MSKERGSVEGLLRRIEEQPDDAELYQQLGRLYLKESLREPEGDGRQKALAAYERALELDPCDPFTHLYLGNWFYAGGDYAAAVERFVYARRLLPDEAVAYWCLGNAWEKLGRQNRAGRYYRQAIRVDPRDRQARRQYRGWKKRRSATRTESQATPPPDEGAPRGNAKGAPDEARFGQDRPGDGGGLGDRPGDGPPAGT